MALGTHAGPYVPRVTRLLPNKKELHVSKVTVKTLWTKGHRVSLCYSKQIPMVLNHVALGNPSKTLWS